jgi:hypothetical protein
MKGRAMKLLLLILCAFYSLCYGENRFVLETEHRTNYADNGTITQFLTKYTYDASGKRIQQRAWDGADSMVAPMSTIKFAYDIAGAVVEELLLAGGDTMAIVRYAYSGGKPVAIRTLSKDNSLRFMDSLIYDGQGRNVEEQRISSSGVKTFFHRYNFDAQGKKISDTLIELVSGSFAATQAILFAYNGDTTVATEAQWRLNGSSWYCICTAFMYYSSGTLVAVATYEREGAGTSMMDSLAYTYDAYGNRTKEEDYDGSKALTHRIAYSWRDTQPSIVLMSRNARSDQRSVLSSKEGRLAVDLSSQNRGMITIFDMAGKRMGLIAVDHSGSVALTGIIGKGLYIVVFSTSAINKQTMNFTSYN